MSHVDVYIYCSLATFAKYVAEMELKKVLSDANLRGENTGRADFGFRPEANETATF